MSAIVTPGPQQNKCKLLDQVRDVTPARQKLNILTKSDRNRYTSPAMRGLVRVQIVGAVGETAIYRSRMPRALREAYYWLGADALVNEATADWIIADHERLSGAGVKPPARKESAA